MFYAPERSVALMLREKPKPPDMSFWLDLAELARRRTTDRRAQFAVYLFRMRASASPAIRTSPGEVKQRGFWIRSVGASKAVCLLHLLLLAIDTHVRVPRLEYPEETWARCWRIDILGQCVAKINSNLHMVHNEQTIQS